MSYCSLNDFIGRKENNEYISNIIESFKKESLKLNSRLICLYDGSQVRNKKFFARPIVRDSEIKKETCFVEIFGFVDCVKHGDGLFQSFFYATEPYLSETIDYLNLCIKPSIYEWLLEDIKRLSLIFKEKYGETKHPFKTINKVGLANKLYILNEYGFSADGKFGVFCEVRDDYKKGKDMFIEFTDEINPRMIPYILTELYETIGDVPKFEIYKYYFEHKINYDKMGIQQDEANKIFREMIYKMFHLDHVLK